MKIQLLTLFLVYNLLSCAYSAMEVVKSSMPGNGLRLARQAQRYGTSNTGGREQPIYRPNAGYIFRGGSPNFSGQYGGGAVKSQSSPFSSGGSRPSSSSVGSLGPFSFGGSSGNRQAAFDSNRAQSQQQPQYQYQQQQLQQQQLQHQQQPQNSIRAGPFGRPDLEY